MRLPVQTLLPLGIRITNFRLFDVELAGSDRNDKRELHYKNTDEGQGQLLLRSKLSGVLKENLQNMLKCSRCLVVHGWKRTALMVKSGFAISAGRSV